MCESIPQACLPDPGRLSRGGQLLPRRSVLTALGGFVLAGCMPAASPTRSLAEAYGPSGSGTPCPPCGPGDQPAARPAPRPRRAYEFVRRSTWGAATLRDNHDPMERVTRITVHHTAEVPGVGERSDAELVKGIQRFHQDTRGWADIGYHWIIGRDGRVYEGRALGVQGAHAGGGNNIENLGVSVMGDYTKALPDTKVLRTLTLFLRTEQRRYGVASDQVFGHRDFKATECPGSSLYAWLKRFKGAV
jgi:hypothetical protein